MTSAYPHPVEDLLPRARELATKLGRTPSRNKLMAELRVGADKANAVKRALTDLDTEPQATPEMEPARLHVVTESEPAPPTTPDPFAGPVTPEPTTTPDPIPTADAGETSTQVTTPVDPGTDPERTPRTATDETKSVSTPTPPQVRSRIRSWPVLLLAAPAFVAIWSGWVGLGGFTGFGVVHPLPGIWDGLRFNTAITLPIGVETYAAYALRVWLSQRVPHPARQFARWSAIGSLLLGALGQVAYHLMNAAGMTQAPWPIVTLVACLPVAVLGMGAALAHLMNTDHD